MSAFEYMCFHFCYHCIKMKAQMLNSNLKIDALEASFEK